jgi:hypothetical protein
MPGSHDHARQAVLTDWLTLKLRPMFDGRVLPINEDIPLKWRLSMEEGRKTGHTYSQIDLSSPQPRFTTDLL